MKPMNSSNVQNSQSGPSRRALLTLGAAAVAGIAASQAKAQVFPGGQEPNAPRDPMAGRAAEPTLAMLLEQASIPYQVKRSDRGEIRYTIAVQSEMGRTEVVAREIQMRWRHRDGSPVKAVFLYAPVIRFADGLVPPTALLKLLADKNNDLAFGNVGIGKRGVFYSNSLWLRNADAEMLNDVLTIAHTVSIGFGRECQAFVKPA